MAMTQPERFVANDANAILHCAYNPDYSKIEVNPFPNSNQF